MDRSGNARARTGHRGREANYFALSSERGQHPCRTHQLWGDFSPYTFRLVNDAAAAAQDNFPSLKRSTGFDPQLAEVTFSFKVECGPEFDCAPVAPDCPPNRPRRRPSTILRKDYSSFRQVMLDRLNQLLPSWNATTEADIGVMMAEVVCVRRRSNELSAGCGDHRGIPRDRAQPHLSAASCAAGGLPGARGMQRARVDSGRRVGATFLDHAMKCASTRRRRHAVAGGGAGNEEAALDAGVVVFEPMQEAHALSRTQPDVLLHLGRQELLPADGATEATLLRHVLPICASAMC